MNRIFKVIWSRTKGCYSEKYVETFDNDIGICQDDWYFYLYCYVSRRDYTN